MLYLTSLRKTIRNVKRFQEILRIVLTYGFEGTLDYVKIEPFIGKARRFFLRQRGREYVRMSLHMRIRLMLEELGPAFVKLGQMLSTRPDICPPELARELSKLQDNVQPFPGAEAVKIVESQLGQPLEKLFLSFNETPSAAASIAQIHRAVTVSGREVVVKIQRPGIESVIKTDLQILSDLAGMASRRFPDAELYAPMEIVDEFRRWIGMELDFVQEGRNIDRFRRNFKDDPTVFLPQVYWGLTAKKVLTMDYIDGIHILNVPALERAGLDLKLIARNGANAVLKQIFEQGFFHGDPHPGNILVLENNVIAPIDCGLMGRIDRELLEQIGMLLQGIVTRDIQKILTVLLNIRIMDDDVDVKSLKMDLGDFVERYYQVPLYLLDVEQLVHELIAIIKRYRLKLPRDLYLMLKALMVMEGIGRKLDPECDMVSLAKPYVKKFMLRKFSMWRFADLLPQRLEALQGLFDMLPENIGQLLLKIRRGELGVKVQHDDLDKLIRGLDRSANRLSFSLIIAALIIASSLMTHLDKGPLLVGLPAFGLVGYVIAAFLGFWYIVALMRSGRM